MIESSRPGRHSPHIVQANPAPGLDRRCAIAARCEWKAFPAACLDHRPREDAGNGGRSWWPKPRRVRQKEVTIPLALASVRELMKTPVEVGIVQLGPRHGLGVLVYPHSPNASL